MTTMTEQELYEYFLRLLQEYDKVKHGQYILETSH